jgi:hypothetical protein
MTESRASAARQRRAASVDARVVLALLLVLAAGCTQETTKVPLPVTPAAERADSPVVRRPLPEAPAPAPPEAPGNLASPEPPIVLPLHAQYVCVVDANGQRQQTAIEFAPQVAKLCATNPEMGPCQYERNACRRSGGRVFASEGKEITMATEDEYDKKVMRIRLKSN